MYTKGPWEAVGIERVGGYAIISLAPSVGWGPLAKVLKPIEIKDEEIEANAHLLAAAPEMYEALKELIRRDKIGSIRLPTQASEIIKQAITEVEKC